jgi:hypothetical protein
MVCLLVQAGLIGHASKRRMGFSEIDTVLHFFRRMAGWHVTDQRSPKKPASLKAITFAK